MMQARVLVECDLWSRLSAVGCSRKDAREVHGVGGGSAAVKQQRAKQDEVRYTERSSLNSEALNSEALNSGFAALQVQYGCSTGSTDDGDDRQADAEGHSYVSATIDTTDIEAP